MRIHKDDIVISRIGNIVAVDIPLSESRFVSGQLIKPARGFESYVGQGFELSRENLTSIIRRRDLRRFKFHRCYQTP
jgi:hypothetical protein